MKDLKVRKQNRSLSGLCPFHEEKTPSFTIERDVYHCFGCGAHGTIEDLQSRFNIIVGVPIPLSDEGRKILAQAEKAIKDAGYKLPEIQTTILH